MEKRYLIDLPAPVPEWQRFIYGAGPSGQRSPAAIAWTLEHAALQAGWPMGAYIGSESDLRHRFRVSRTVIRQAIRIVEFHGSMRMKRGREGGLYLTHASVETVAASVATYLHAAGCSAAELTQTEAVARALLSELPEQALMRQLFAHTIRLFRLGDVGLEAGNALGEVIAMRLVTLHPAIPECGAELGPQAELLAQFKCAPPTLRQALRVLDDLGMLQVRRGRGGGYLLQRPSPLGVIRQVFALFASWQQSLDELMTMTWALNLTNLRLCARSMQQLDPAVRARHRGKLEAALAGSYDGSQEPRRWTSLQHQIGLLADSKLVTTLIFCCIGYIGRLGVPGNDRWAGIEQSLGEQEKRIVQALCDGDAPAAERAQRSAQDQIAQLLRVRER